MRVTVIGCSGSFAGPRSPSSCYLVQAEHEGRTWSILLDLGSGALGALQRHLQPTTLDAVLLTHLHPDHCVDLCGLYVMRRYDPSGEPAQRLPVHGPRGTAERISAMYHGIDHGGMQAQFDFVEVKDGAPLTIGPFTLTPYAVRHPVDAFGYRVEADGATLAYTGDTDDCDNLDPLLRDADLALLDSAFVDGRDEVEGIHLTGSRAARAAVRAGGVGRLVLTHIPAWNDPEVCRAQAQEHWAGTVEVATVGSTYELPPAAGSGVVVDAGAAALMWSGYRRDHPDRAMDDEVAPAEHFGDSAAMADELLALVLHGPKRATAGLLADYRAAGEDLPRVGSHRVVCDGSGMPRAVLRVLEARLGPVTSVDEGFAWDEGEGDRTRETWLRAHGEFFSRSCERLDIAYSEDLEAVFTRFAVVWPPEHADD